MVQLGQWLILRTQAGAAAAFTVDLLIYPLDTLKTRQQSRDFLKTFADPSASSKSGPGAGARRTLMPSRDLFRGLYQGIGIVVVATLPAAGTFFTMYEAAKSFVGRLGPDSSSPLPLPRAAVHSAASAIAECASCLVLTPAEVVKQNAQMIRRQQGLPSSPSGGGGGVRGSTSLEALRQLAAGTGAGTGRRLLSGYTALVARNLPFTAIQFPMFEALRARLWQSRRGASGPGGSGEGNRAGLLETGVVTGVSAGLAGSFAAVVTTPMDVVKTRMMLYSPSSSSEAASSVGAGDATRTDQPRSRSGLAVARQVIVENGIVGLFRGSIIRAVWTAVGSGLYLGMYELSRIWLTRRREGGDDDAADDLL